MAPKWFHIEHRLPDREGGTQLSLVRVKEIDAHLHKRRFAPPVLHQEDVSDDAHDHHRMSAQCLFLLNECFILAQPKHCARLCLTKALRDPEVTQQQRPVLTQRLANHLLRERKNIERTAIMGAAPVISRRTSRVCPAWLSRRCEPGAFGVCTRPTGQQHRFDVDEPRLSVPNAASLDRTGALRATLTCRLT